MMKKLRSLILNRFDRAILTGSFSAVAMLLAGTAVIIFVGTALVAVFGVHVTRAHLNFVDSLWEILQRAIDPGQLANEVTWQSRVILLFVTIVGLLLVSTLISIINSTLERRIESARRGRRPVTNSDHIVVVGWNDSGTKLIEELAIAKIEGVDLSVVLLTDEDPVELLNSISEHLRREDEIDQTTNVTKHASSWITVRRARGDNTNDLLELGGIDRARALICLVKPGHDFRTVRTVLASLAALQMDVARKRPVDRPLRVVAQFESESLARRFEMRIERVVKARRNTSGGLLDLQTVTPSLVRNKVEVNVVRSRGLSAVYKDLLDFEGEELYQVPSPSTSLTFGSLVADSHNVPIGFSDGDTFDLWPNWDDEVGNRKVVVLSHSMESAVRYINRGVQIPIDEPFLGQRIGRAKSSRAEHYLFIGANKWLSGLIEELSFAVPSGSTATVLLRDGSEVPNVAGFGSGEIQTRYRNDENDPLDDAQFVSQFDHIIVMANHEIAEEESDAHVLTDVLACRVHIEVVESDKQPTTVVAELRQRASKHIAAVRLADDLLLSDALTACALAQFALYPESGPLLRHLLGHDSPVTLTSIRHSAILENGEHTCWSEVQDRLYRSTGEICLGMRRANLGIGNPEVLINPAGSTMFGPDDDAIVLTKLL